MLNIILIIFNLFFSEHCFKARVGSSRRQANQGSERTCPKSCYTPHCLPKLQRPGWVQSQPCQYSEIPYERQKVWWYWIQVSSSVSAQQLCVHVWFCYQSLPVLLQCCSFLVAGDGTVFEGRGWGVMGAHAKDHNSDSLGIAFMGNFNSRHSLFCVYRIQVHVLQGVAIKW